MTAHAIQCAEGVIADRVVIRCGRDGGHGGNHIGLTDRGTAEWSRIEELRRPHDWPTPF
jgi:hypothetical protein